MVSVTSFSGGGNSPGRLTSRDKRKSAESFREKIISVEMLIPSETSIQV